MFTRHYRHLRGLGRNCMKLLRLSSLGERDDHGGLEALLYSGRFWSFIQTVGTRTATNEGHGVFTTAAPDV